MRGKFAGIFENRIRNLQATFKETIYTYWRFHFNQQKNKTMYVIAESGDTGLLLYKNIGKGKSLSMEDFPVLMFRED